MPDKKLRYKKQEITPGFIKQFVREMTEYYAIIDERYGAEWYDIPIAERQKLEIEIRKEAKQRCL